MALLINALPNPGHKTIGSVLDKMAAIDVDNYITAMIIKKGAIDLRTACVLAHAETAFQPASQAEPDLKTRDVSWNEWYHDNFTTPSTHKHLFVFSRRDLDQMLPIFDISSERRHVTRSRAVFNEEEMFYAMCRFLSSNGTLFHSARDMGRQIPHMSDAINDCVDRLYAEWCVPLLNNGMLMWADRCELWAEAVTRKTGVDGNTICYVDGTTLEIARPTKGQRACFDGHHRAHDFILQGLKAPCGLMPNLQPPREGRRHDAYNMTSFAGSSEF